MKYGIWVSSVLVAVAIGVAFFGQSNEYTDSRYSDISYEGSRLKIMTYNVWHGLEDVQRKEGFIAYMNEVDVDIAALQELNGMKRGELSELAATYGHTYSEQLKYSGYPVGITSKHPIELVKKLRFGLHHGALHVKIEGIHYLVVHLSPKNADKRSSEVRQLVDYLNKLEVMDTQDVIILGDLNAHSIEDHDYLIEKDIAVNYSGYNLVDGLLDYSVIGYLVDNGFFDSYMAGVEREERTYGTYPTDAIDVRGERIDFILLSESLSSYLISSDIDVNDYTTVISDHYPVISVLEKEGQ